MKHAYVFPGQGSQFPGMGKSLFDSQPQARQTLERADEILGFPISEVMFSGSEEDLKQTRVTQPAIFLHSVMAWQSLQDPKPDMVAGHSLGEFSALVASGVLAFEDALRLVAIRAQAMQKACEHQESTMAAILGLDDAQVEAICAAIDDEVVVPANYNCPGQLVISGSRMGVELACERLKEAGAKRALLLPVGGAFHSPLMAPAREELRQAIERTPFGTGVCPVYQNVCAEAVLDPAQIQANLIEQLTGAVRWSQSVQAMIRDGAQTFTEVGPGKVLQGLVLKIDRNMVVDGVN